MRSHSDIGKHNAEFAQRFLKANQNLGAVADFLGGLAGSSSPDWKVDVFHASQAVKLAEVCDRLTGRKSDAVTSEDVTGDFEDFENWPMTG